MQIREYLLLLIFIFQIINCSKKEIFYRCGVDDTPINPIPIKNVIPMKNDDRKLNDDDEFNLFHFLIGNLMGQN